MADNEALFTPELVFFDWECATPGEVFARLEGELAPRGYIAEGCSTPSARARMLSHGSRYAGGKHCHSAYRSGVCGQALYRGGEARRARDI